MTAPTLWFQSVQGPEISKQGQPFHGHNSIFASNLRSLNGLGATFSPSAPPNPALTYGIRAYGPDSGTVLTMLCRRGTYRSIGVFHELKNSSGSCVPMNSRAS